MGLKNVATGAVIPTTETPVYDPAGHVWRADGIGYIDMTGTTFEVAPPPNRTTLSTIEFFDQFTPTEEAGIRAYAGDATKPAAPVLAVLLGRLDRAPSIDLTNPTVTGGFASLVALGLLTQPRATAILAGLPG